MKLRKLVSLGLATSMLASLALTGCGSEEGGGDSEAKGKVYYLNFKPEADAAWKKLAEEYTKHKVDYTDLTSLIVIYNILKKDFNNVVITLEDKGCFTYDNGYKLVPTLKRKAIDSTGAGDIFHGAFAYSVANKFDMIKTLKIANISGAISVTRIGGQYSIPSLDEVMEKYNECNK